MIISPYQSTPCKDYDLNKIVREVMIDRIDGKLLSEHYPAEMVGPASTEIPPFSQLLTIVEFGDRRDAPQVVFDARSLVRMSRAGEVTYSISNANEMELALVRSRLQLFWQGARNSRLDLLRAGDLAPIAFINWLSKSLVGKLGLDPHHQMTITAITGYYYACLYHEQGEFDDQTKLKIVQQITRWTRIAAADVLEIIDPLEYLGTINDYIGAIKSRVESLRINQLNLGLLYALVRGSWFGSNSQEVVAVSLEHPPTYLALVYCALQLRGYRNAMLARVVTLAIRGGNDTDLIKNLSFLLKDYNRAA